MLLIRSTAHGYGYGYAWVWVWVWVWVCTVSGDWVCAHHGCSVHEEGLCVMPRWDRCSNITDKTVLVSAC